MAYNKKKKSFFSEILNEIIIYSLSQDICAHEVICHKAAMFLSKVTFRELIASHSLLSSLVWCV